jgi:hypothetical protein
MNIDRTFKPVNISIRRGLRLKGKKQGDEPIQVITHTYMEMSQ